MKTHSSTFRKKSRAFTLVEAVVALGVISFSLVAVVNVLPAGLESQKQAVDQSFGTQALSRVATALKGVRRNEIGSLEFLPPVKDLNVGSGSATFGSTTYYLMPDGTLTQTLDRKALGKVHIEQYPPVNLRLLPVHVSVAWPARAEFKSGKWTKAEGSTSTFLYLTLPQ